MGNFNSFSSPKQGNQQKSPLSSRSPYNQVKHDSQSKASYQHENFSQKQETYDEKSEGINDSSIQKSDGDSLEKDINNWKPDILTDNNRSTDSKSIEKEEENSGKNNILENDIPSNFNFFNLDNDADKNYSPDILNQGVIIISQNDQKTKLNELFSNKRIISVNSFNKDYSENDIFKNESLNNSFIMNDKHFYKENIGINKLELENVFKINNEIPYNIIEFNSFSDEENKGIRIDENINNFINEENNENYLWRISNNDNNVPNEYFDGSKRNAIDNIYKKIRARTLKDFIPFYNENIIGDSKFCKINGKISSCFMNKETFRTFASTPMKKILSKYRVSGKYTTFDKNFNEILIKKLEKDEKNKEINQKLELTYLCHFQVWRGDASAIKKYPCLNGLKNKKDNFINDLRQKYNEKYIEKVKFYIDNLESFYYIYEYAN